ncbi:Proteasome [Macleaya cordata]|uniref:Proteasome n=1 Tax=Macleaya cordata TaxID=56857 RepID=A0A200QIV6_MACCD|nr:Proteasome [Macleaya cordata]
MTKTPNLYPGENPIDMLVKDYGNVPYLSDDEVDFSHSTNKDLLVDESRRTTTVGIIFEEAVILAAYCGEMGDNTIVPEDKKVRESELNLACTITGHVDTKELKDFLHFWKNMFKDVDEKKSKRVQLLKDTSQRLRGYHLGKKLKPDVEILVGGWHREEPQDVLLPRLAVANISASFVKTEEFYCSGLASEHVEVIVENEYDKQMKPMTAVSLVQRALLKASYYNDYIGGVVDVLTIYPNGHSEITRKTIAALCAQYNELEARSPGFKYGSSVREGANISMEDYDADELSNKEKYAHL